VRPKARNNELDGGQIKGPETGLGRFDPYRGSREAFRRHQRSVNGQLMGFLCAMSRAGDPVFVEGASYG
jgi:hypothetical protein